MTRLVRRNSVGPFRRWDQGVDLLVVDDMHENVTHRSLSVDLGEPKPHPFKWAKSADQILASVTRSYQRTQNT